MTCYLWPRWLLANNRKLGRRPRTLKSVLECDRGCCLTHRLRNTRLALDLGPKRRSELSADGVCVSALAASLASKRQVCTPCAGLLSA